MRKVAQAVTFPLEQSHRQRRCDTNVVDYESDRSACRHDSRWAVSAVPARVDGCPKPSKAWRLVGVWSPSGSSASAYWVRCGDGTPTPDIGGTPLQANAALTSCAKLA